MYGVLCGDVSWTAVHIKVSLWQCSRIRLVCKHGVLFGDVRHCHNGPFIFLVILN
jgi:hypothetical protein